MRSIFVTVVCILLAHTLFGQSFDYIDEKVKVYPKFHDTKKLAKQINADFSTDLEKARAIFYWITHNISYDFAAKRVTAEKLRKNNSRKKSKERLQVEREKIVADYTIKNRVAVCDGYSTLFKQLGDLTNVHSIVIEGYTKTEKGDLGKMGKLDHAWNAVLINNEWYLLDATWGAGVYSTQHRKFIPDFQDVYFMTKPELFFLKHYPKDPKWLLIGEVKNQFIDIPLFSTRYLELGISIKAPATGVIESPTGAGISFEIEIPDELLFYRFSYVYTDDQYAERMNFKVIDGVGHATIPAPNKYPAYLEVYYNREIIALFRINESQSVAPLVQE